jgi:hypothetical protein
MFSSYAELEPGMSIRDIVKRDVCNYVRMSHSEEQQKDIVSV